MLVGTADPRSLVAGCSTMSGFDTESVSLPGAETLQLLCEVSAAAAQAALPPGLHPTLPGLLGWLVQRFPESPWGDRFTWRRRGSSAAAACGRAAFSWEPSVIARMLPRTCAHAGDIAWVSPRSCCAASTTRSSPRWERRERCCISAA